jgi:hypothetical protein
MSGTSQGRHVTGCGLTLLWKYADIHVGVLCWGLCSEQDMAHVGGHRMIWKVNLWEGEAGLEESVRSSKLAFEGKVLQSQARHFRPPSKLWGTFCVTHGLG